VAAAEKKAALAAYDHQRVIASKNAQVMKGMATNDAFTRSIISSNNAEVTAKQTAYNAAVAKEKQALAALNAAQQEEKLALGLTRVLNHLSEAVGDVPVEAWAEMLAAKDVGIDEIRKAMGVAA
jgi:hypothetical protein